MGTKIIIILVILGLALPVGFLFFEKEVLAGNYLPKADLIKGIGPEVYLLENGIRHWIPDPETFNHFRYNWRNIKIISDGALEKYSQGDNISRYDDYPDGTLLRGSGPKVYLIELGKKRWIPSPVVFERNSFGWGYIIQVDDDDLDDYKEGEALALSEPNRYPETIILESPKQGEVVEESEITFKYSGTDPLGPTSDLSFEVFLKGYDKNWQGASQSGEKKYRLSGESRAYTFYVRAKNREGYLDPTPASVDFSVGLSPLYGKIEIRRIYQSRDNFRRDYLILENRDQNRQIINVSGWKIKVKKDSVVIPQAIEKLKSSFSKTNYSNIKLAYGDEIIISASSSPRGVNFQTNQCTGYLDQTNYFYPSLDRSCPRLEKSDYSHLKKTCRDFIEDINRCEMSDYVGNLDIAVDSQCTEFLNKTFNYQSCYDEHYQEVDFFEGKWRVFLDKSTDIFDDDTDTIILEDQNGLVVDRYSY